MFGETTISYVKIWNHPIETTSCKQMFQVPGRNTVHNSFKKKTLSCFPPEGVRTRNCQLRFTSKPGWFEPPSPCCNPLLVPFRIGKMDMDVSQNRGENHPKWMVYFMENPIEMDDLEVFPYFWKHPYPGCENDCSSRSSQPSKQAVFFFRYSLRLRKGGLRQLGCLIFFSNEKSNFSPSR